MGLAGVAFLPVAVFVGFDSVLTTRGVSFVAASGLLHAVYYFTLTQAYRYADLSVVYPIARGLGVTLVPFFALPLFGERPSMIGIAGVALVVMGIVTGGIGGRKQGASLAPGRGVWWAIVTGFLIAAYSLLDRAGVQWVHPVPYVSLMNLLAVFLLSPRALADLGALRTELKKSWRSVMVAACVNLTGYLLVLFAFRIAQTGYVVATRELSIVMSTLIGGYLFKEANLKWRLIGSAIIVGGGFCIAFAG